MGESTLVRGGTVFDEHVGRDPRATAPLSLIHI